MASGEMSKGGFTDFLTTAFRYLAAHSTDGSIHDICMDWRHIEEMMTAGNNTYSELKNVCVWDKKNAGMGTFYRIRNKLIFIWKSEIAPHINNFELGQHGRSRTNVWEYPGITSSGPARLEQLSLRAAFDPLLKVRHSGVPGFLRPPQMFGRSQPTAVLPVYVCHRLMATST